MVFDLDTDDVPASQPGEVVPFEVSFSKCIPDLLAGKEVEPVISRDTYGFLLTIYTPLRDSQGVCQCYAAVDYSILMVDVNFLKRMNDTHGHEKGNEYLKNAAELISRVFGEEMTYRTGGDKFVVIADGEAQQRTGEQIRRFKAEMAALQDTDGLQPWQKISAAVGIAAYDRSVDICTEDVLKRADAAMYQDKVAMKAQRRD